ncbi:hypothetical protein MKZ38_005546 [Zalerion maritima]|uniref:Uncharacterized protein n=1 Tax=Zalerion maritima TaxID=339359 RepID=A0AAD5RL02_9PEZI|nr:hypothetical protein MKZ38_005546 [Zalerion maritima]
MASATPNLDMLKLTMLIFGLTPSCIRTCGPPRLPPAPGNILVEAQWQVQRLSSDVVLGPKECATLFEKCEDAGKGKGGGGVQICNLVEQGDAFTVALENPQEHTGYKDVVKDLADMEYECEVDGENRLSAEVEHVNQILYSAGWDFWGLSVRWKEDWKGEFIIVTNATLHIPGLPGAKPRSQNFVSRKIKYFGQDDRKEITKSQSLVLLKPIKCGGFFLVGRSGCRDTACPCNMILLVYFVRVGSVGNNGPGGKPVGAAQLLNQSRFYPSPLHCREKVLNRYRNSSKRGRLSRAIVDIQVPFRVKVWRELPAKEGFPSP